MTGKGERKECNNKYKRLIPKKEKTHSGKKKKKKQRACSPNTGKLQKKVRI